MQIPTICAVNIGWHGTLPRSTPRATLQILFLHNRHIHMQKGSSKNLVLTHAYAYTVFVVGGKGIPTTPNPTSPIGKHHGQHQSNHPHSPYGKACATGNPQPPYRVQPSHVASCAKLQGYSSRGNSGSPTCPPNATSTQPSASPRHSTH